MPRRETTLPLYRPWIDEEEIAAVAEVMRSGWIGMGARVAEFESRFAEWVGVKHAVSTNSCTAALHLSLVAAGVASGDLVLTTPFTFTATAEAIHHSGATIRFVDIDPDTLNLRPDLCADAVQPNVKGIVPVHIAGLPCDMEAFRSLARDKGLFLLDDAAHAVLAETDGKRIGACADASAFSFYPTKNLTTCEGGMVTTDDDALAARVKRLRYHGLDKDTWLRQSAKQPWMYDVVEQGFKSHLTDLQAAIGLVQIGKLERQRAIRERIAARYREAFGDLEEVHLPVEPSHGRHGWHLYVIRLELERLTIDRDAFVRELHARRIGAGVHYIPLHFLSHYQKACRVREGDFPATERAFSRVVSLPFWPGMSDDDTEDVVDAVRDVVRRFARRNVG
jgi:dTDP-4-amino-4,6-dideoxygalactose transaminase